MSNARTEAAWCRELAQWWSYFNEEYLGGALRAPSIELFDSVADLGRWDRNRRLIGLSRSHLREDPWSEVMDTLRHEMAHQFAHEILRATDERPHGAAFQDTMRRLRVEPKAGAPAAEAITGRIAKLLSLASSANEHEAQIAMNKARELLLRYNLEPSSGAPKRYFAQQIGPLKKRHQAWEYELAAILGDFFFVRCIWVPSYDTGTLRAGTRLELYGTHTNLEMASYVHGFLSKLLERLWRGYKVVNNIPNDRDRRGYFLGLLQGFQSKLEAQDKIREQTRALVYQGDPQLEAYYRYRNPRIQRVGGTSVQQSEAFLDGVVKGQTITINKPVQSGPSAEAPKRLASGSSRGAR